jgi:hypothetical protein
MARALHRGIRELGHVSGLFALSRPLAETPRIHPQQCRRPTEATRKRSIRFAPIDEGQCVAVKTKRPPVSGPREDPRSNDPRSTRGGGSRRRHSTGNPGQVAESVLTIWAFKHAFESLAGPSFARRRHHACGLDRLHVISSHCVIAFTAWSTVLDGSRPVRCYLPSLVSAFATRGVRLLLLAAASTCHSPVSPADVTASAASKVQPPAKTDSRSSTIRSSGLSRRCGGPAGKMHNGCRRLCEPTWALPSVAGCDVTIVVGAGTTVGRPARLTWLITALPGSPS